MFTPTRAAALERLHGITPRLGRLYAGQRNTDRGPDAAPSTSALSPYLRRRMLLEAEAVAAAREAHGEGAEKFVQEVFWRTYFKGYLEGRPGLWAQYRTLAAEGRTRLDQESGLRAAYDRAVTGRTGIECFDDWALELVQHSWLHNHTRMWFASIWIFTLGLPWALGADFFMQHLIDGDPASNTLSWRWVAGLHTRGKVYAARAENIRRYTDGRYDPAGLNEDPEPLEEPEHPGPKPLAKPAPAPTGEVALLLHLDDLNPESLECGSAKITRVAGLLAHADRAAANVIAFDEAAMEDALARAAAALGAEIVPYAENWSAGLPVITPWAPVGPSADALPAEAIRLRRAWDDAVWPRALKGFFQVKAAIPRVLAAV